MSMDKSAIEKIQESQTLTQLLADLEKSGTHIPVTAIPEGMKIESMESYMLNASWYRQDYRTAHIEDYVKYGLANKAPGAICFINNENMKAVTTFDLGTVENPGHKRHEASLTLKKTAAYRAMIAICGNKNSQKEAAEFIEDWGDHIVVSGSKGEKMSNRAAAKALRDITIETAREISSQVEDFGESMSAMEKIEAKNKEALPAYIYFECEPYLGLLPRTFEIRTSILSGGDRPTISFRFLKAEAVAEEIAEEFKELLEESFEGEIETFIGEA